MSNVNIHVHDGIVVLAASKAHLQQFQLVAPYAGRGGSSCVSRHKGRCRLCIQCVSGRWTFMEAPQNSCRGRCQLWSLTQAAYWSFQQRQDLDGSTYGPSWVARPPAPSLHGPAYCCPRCSTDRRSSATGTSALAG